MLSYVTCLHTSGCMCRVGPVPWPQNSLTMRRSRLAATFWSHSTSIRLSEKMEYLYNYCIGILCHLDSKSDVGKPSVTFTADSPK